MNAFHLTQTLINLEFIILYPHVKLDLDVLDEDMADSLIELGALELFGVEIDEFLEIFHPWADIISVQEESCFAMDVVREILLDCLAEMLRDDLIIF